MRVGLEADVADHGQMVGRHRRARKGGEPKDLVVIGHLETVERETLGEYVVQGSLRDVGDGGVMVVYRCWKGVMVKGV